MLAAWGRMKFPHIFDGVIAGSAPIWTFLGEVSLESCSAAPAPSPKCTTVCYAELDIASQDPPYDANSFAKIVTRDASPEAGSAAACVPNMRKGWQVLLNAGGSESGRKLISDAMHLCPHSTITSNDDAILLAQWLQSAWDYLAMVRAAPCRALRVLSTSFGSISISSAGRTRRVTSHILVGTCSTG